AAMSWQTMHEDGIGFGAGEKLGVDLIRLENLAPSLRLCFLSHARPDIGVDHIRSEGRYLRIVGNGAAGICLRAAFSRPGHSICLRLISWRGCNPNMCSQLRARKHQRVRHVVAIADIRDLESGDTPL